MAVLRGGRDSFTEADPDWLGLCPESPAPSPLPPDKRPISEQTLGDSSATKAAKPPQQAIPSPPADPDRSDAHLGTGFKLQPQGDATSANSGDIGTKPAQGDELKLRREPPLSEKPEETAKPAPPAMETSAEKPAPAADRDNVTPPLVIPDNG